jgi:CheY-like chemotaxis protein
MDESGSSLAPPRPVVLVAEDDPSVRFTIELVLEGEGFDVVLAEDGQRALDMAFTKSPDAILLDLTMPKLDGQQVLRRLREAEHTARIPVFVLSGRVRDPNDVWDGAHFVGKPFDPDSLVESIRTALQA